MTSLPVPVPRTWTPGETEVGAYLNTIRDAINFLLNTPFAEVYQSTVTTLVTGTATVLGFDATLIDTYGGHSNTTLNSRYTAQVAGWYELTGVVQFNPNSTGYRLAYWRKNGAFPNPSTYNTELAQVSPSATTVLLETLQLQLAVGDYVEMVATQTSGGNLNTFSGAGDSTRMSVRWIHA